jgi:hypothetical protein
MDIIADILFYDIIALSNPIGSDCYAHCSRYLNIVSYVHAGVDTPQHKL